MKLQTVPELYALRAEAVDSAFRPAAPLTLTPGTQMERLPSIVAVPSLREEEPCCQFTYDNPYFHS